MTYGEVSGVNKRVSRLVQGTTVVSSERLEEGMELLDGVFEQGCNTFDSAHIYGGGDCERVLGRWMRNRGIREEVVVLTKGAHHNADRDRVTPFDISSDLHDSLARIGSDYIDLYVLHRDDPKVGVGPIVEVLNEHLAAGKIRAFGGSNWSQERIAEANAYAKAHGLVGFAVTSPQFSLTEMVEPPWPGCLSLGGAEGAKAREWYRTNDVPVFSWSSLARGFLSGRHAPQELARMPIDTDGLFVRCFRSDANLARLERAIELARDKAATVPQIALAYLLCQPVTVFPLIGCETTAEFRANADACDLRLTPAECEWLDLTRDSR